MRRFAAVSKAVAAFLAPTLTDVAGQLQTEDFNPAQVGRVAFLGLVTSLAVWAVPNEEA